MITQLSISLLCAIKKFARNRQGVTAIEYAVIAVAVSTAVLAVFNTDGLSTALESAMDKVTANIEAAKEGNSETSTGQEGTGTQNGG